VKPNSQLLSIFRTGIFLLSFFVGGSVYGQATPGVTDNQILIGSCSALEGPSHALGTQQIKGAQAYFNLVNDEGGVAGRKLKLVAYDDSYDPAKTETCFKRLQSQNVFALGFFVGTPHSGEVPPDGGGRKDSAGGTVHRSADALHSVAALGD
jgi:substrate-binding family protein